MSSGDPPPVPRHRLFTLRVIHLAMLSACLLFGLIAGVVRLRQPQPTPDPPMVSYVGVAVAILTGLTYLFVPGVILDGWRRRLAHADDPVLKDAPAPGRWQSIREAAQDMAVTRSGGDPYWAMLMTSFLIGACLLEATVLYQLVAYMIEGWPWSLGLATFFWAGLLLKFPTEGGVTRWLDMQHELVDHARVREVMK